MLILAFESSARPASVALLRDGQLLSQYSQCSQLTHSRTLLPMAEDMLKNAELTLDDVDLFAVAHGPGSFTGIRIGVSTVKGLAWASDKPCVGVSTLEAMAWHGLAAGGLICPVMDARRSQVLAGLSGRGRGGTHGEGPRGRGAPIHRGARESPLAERLGRGHGRPGQDPRQRRHAAARVPAPLAGGTGAPGPSGTGKRQRLKFKYRRRTQS